MDALVITDQFDEQIFFKVPTRCRLNVGTVSTRCRLNVGTVPTFKLSLNMAIEIFVCSTFIEIFVSLVSCTDQRLNF